MRDPSRAYERIDPASRTRQVLRGALHIEPWECVLIRTDSAREDRYEAIGKRHQRLIVHLREQRSGHRVHRLLSLLRDTWADAGRPRRMRIPDKTSVITELSFAIAQRVLVGPRNTAQRCMPTQPEPWLLQGGHTGRL